MRTPKNQIKKIILKKIKFNDTIPAELFPELLKESYKTFLIDLKVLKQNLFKSDDYELWFDRIIFDGIDNRPYYYKIQRDGHLIDISREVWQQNIDNQNTIDEALKS